MARPYLNEAPIGGHGTNSIGETVLYAKMDLMVSFSWLLCLYTGNSSQKHSSRVSRDRYSGVNVLY